MWDNGASLREISSAFERKGNWRAVYRQMLILRKNFGWFQPRPKNTGVESAKVTYANWLRLWDEGKGTREIALIAKRIPNTVSTIVSTLRKKYGLFPPQRKPTFSELYPDVVELWNAGKTTMEIAASTGRTYRATSHLISRGRYYRALAPRERGRKQFLVPNGPKTRRNRGQTTDKKLSWLFARIALGSVSHERRASLKRTLDLIGKWSMADVFVVAVLLACLAIRAADTSTDAHPLWGFYFFLAYCLLSMVVSYALGHLEPEAGDPPERVALQPSTIATRALLSVVCFFVSGYFIIYLSLGSRAANAATASVYNPNELHDSVEQLPLHSTACIPFSMPRNGTCTTRVSVPQGNSLNIFVVSATQVDAVKAGGRFFFIRGSEMLETRS